MLDACKPGLFPSSSLVGGVWHDEILPHDVQRDSSSCGVLITQVSHELSSSIIWRPNDLRVISVLESNRPEPTSTNSQSVHEFSSNFQLPPRYKDWTLET